MAQIEAYHKKSTQSKLLAAQLEAYAALEVHLMKSSDENANDIWPIGNPNMLGESTMIKTSYYISCTLILVEKFEKPQRVRE